MSRQELIELALQGVSVAEQNEDALYTYVDLAEHLISTGHADNCEDVDVILAGMTLESAEMILDGMLLNEAKGDVESGLEADPEGYMVLRQIATAENAALRIKTYIGNNKTLQLPAWVQSKMTTAADYLDTVADYLLSDT